MGVRALVKSRMRSEGAGHRAGVLVKHQVEDKNSKIVLVVLCKRKSGTRADQGSVWTTGGGGQEGLNSETWCGETGEILGDKRGIRRLKIYWRDTERLERNWRYWRYWKDTGRDTGRLEGQWRDTGRQKSHWETEEIMKRCWRGTGSDTGKLGILEIPER